MIVMLLSPRPTRIYKSDQVQISPMCVSLTSKLSVSPWKQPSTTVRSSLDVLALVCSSSCAIKTCLTLREYFFILAGKVWQMLPSVWLMACWEKWRWTAAFLGKSTKRKDNKRKKGQDLAVFEPITSWSWGVRSTTALKLKIIHVILAITWSDSFCMTRISKVRWNHVWRNN